jgi:hypothetical protein
LQLRRDQPGAAWAPRGVFQPLMEIRQDRWKQRSIEARHRRLWVLHRHGAT